MLQDFSVSSFTNIWVYSLLIACPISFDVFLSSAEPKIFRLWSFTGTRNCTSTSTKTSVFDPHHDVMGFSNCFFTIVHFSFFETLRKMMKNVWVCFVVVFFVFQLSRCFPTSFSFLRHSRNSRTTPSPTTDDPRFHQRTETSPCLHPKHWPQDWPREESSEIKTWQPQIEIHNIRSESTIYIYFISH